MIRVFADDIKTENQYAKKTGINMEYKNNKTALRIIDYDKMLYPQYKGYFEDRTISQSTWEALQNEAKRRINEIDSGEESAADSVIAHWKSIVNGTIPFGYKIKND